MSTNIFLTQDKLQNMASQVYATRKRVSPEYEALEPIEIRPFNGWTISKGNQPRLIYIETAGIISILLLHMAEFVMQ
jgi:hypothetical protein